MSKMLNNVSITCGISCKRYFGPSSALLKTTSNFRILLPVLNLTPEVKYTTPLSKSVCITYVVILAFRCHLCIVMLIRTFRIPIELLPVPIITTYFDFSDAVPYSKVDFSFLSTSNRALTLKLSGFLHGKLLPVFRVQCYHLR